jgi:hypothetical protein
MTQPSIVSVNVLGFIDQGEVGNDPYRIDHDGHPYVAVGDGGIVLGLRLGDSVWQPSGDHAAPGACVVHPNDDARYAVVGQACVGNTVTVRTGAATGATGVVLGKRGGGERVIVVFAPEVLARLRPSDQVAIRTRGQGSAAPVAAVTQMNIDPAVLPLLNARAVSNQLAVGVRSIFASKEVGNGIGRPMAMWDVDLQLNASDPGAATLRLGDVVAITDLDARYNAGYRRGALSVGLVVHASSPQPGHGPGVMILWSGPADAFNLTVEGDAHQGLREDRLLTVAEK